MARTRFSQRLGAFGFTAVIGVTGVGTLVRSCAPAPAPAPRASAAAISAPLPVSPAVVSIVNQHRAAAGLAPLAASQRLEGAAIGQSTDQAKRGVMTHRGANGSSGGDRIRFVGYRWSTWGENVAAGQTTPEQVMDAWMNSAGHRANILNPAFTEIGVGAVTGGNGVTYWTMDLAAPR